MAATVKSGKDWAVLVTVGVRVNEGVFVGTMVEVPVGLGLFVGMAEVSVKDCFGSIARVEVGASIAVGVDLKIIGKTPGTITIIAVQNAAMARMMAKMI